MKSLKDGHYFPLPSQGNIYTFSNLKFANNTNKLLVATLKREVYCFEYQETPLNVLKPTLKEVSFTYIPSGAEIISLDAFNKSDTSNDFVIGITIIKNSVDLNNLETYLNIYSEGEESKEFNLDSIAQNCLTLELNYIPYCLGHTYLVQWQGNKLSNKETIFLLSGSDNQVHLYKETKSNHNYKEGDCKEYFPEFSKLPSVPNWFDVIYYNDYSERLSAVGCECGYLRLCKVNTKTNKIIFNVSTKFVSSIINVKFQIEATERSMPSALSVLKHTKSNIISTTNAIVPQFNLIIVNSILPGVYFKDVAVYGLQKYCSLKRSESTCISTCLELADLDFDGCEEILIGNSARELLHYKFSKDQAWQLADIKKLVSPILSIFYIDLTGDGVKELVLLTTKGVYIYQHDRVAVQQILIEKMKELF